MTDGATGAAADAADAAGRAAEAARLFARADQEGSLTLATLTDIEEYVLGADRWLLVDGAGWLAWLAVGDERRDEHTAQTLQALLERGDAVHVEETTDGYQVTLSAPLGLVEVARMSAYFTVVPSAVTGAVPEGSGVVAPLLYAVVDEVAGLRGFVAEFRQPARHVYRLLSVEHACSALAQWAQGALRSEEYGGRADAVVIEVLRHREGEPPLASGMSVSVDGDRLRGATLLFDGAREEFDASDRDTLVAQARLMLEDAAQRASSEEGGPR